MKRRMTMRAASISWSASRATVAPMAETAFHFVFSEALQIPENRGLSSFSGGYPCQGGKDGIKFRLTQQRKDF